MLGWNLSADDLSDLHSRTLSPGWDDRIFISEGGIIIPTTVYLKKRKGYVTKRAVSARRKPGNKSLWRCVSFALKDLRAPMSELPPELHCFASTSDVCSHDDPFPQLMDAPAFTFCPSWMGIGFCEQACSSEGTILRKYNETISLSVLYDELS